jgi:para-aminobenzoate synthetase/4-amino-4-deoxychorismate lyase
MLETRPMKGTAPRDDDPDLDEKIRQWLRSDPKNRAENLMITDLMRNDFGRIARIGTVEVFDPFRVEAYNRLFQMTTGVRCKLRKNLSLVDLFKATFPPGSVTGAPKINTMKIISSVENSLRKVYTGTIGYLAPDGDFVMSVAIRTIIATASGNCEMGVGSGIVSDSQPDMEYEETLLKVRFLNPDPSGKMHLLETILLQKDGSLLWFNEHLDRMEESATTLNYPFQRRKAIVAIRDHIKSRTHGPAILRLLLTQMGKFNVEVQPYYPLKGNPRRVIVSHHRVDPGDELLQHKTTARSLYDTELAKVRAAGYVEVLFTNNRGHLTEGTFTNLFFHDLSGWRTPEPTCGLLPGIWREKYLEETAAIQGEFSLKDLQSADRIVLGNSVRGAIEVDEVVDPDGLPIYRRSAALS